MKSSTLRVVRTCGSTVTHGSFGSDTRRNSELFLFSSVKVISSILAKGLLKLPEVLSRLEDIDMEDMSMLFMALRTSNNHLP